MDEYLCRGSKEYGVADMEILLFFPGLFRMTFMFPTVDANPDPVSTVIVYKSG